MISPKRLSVPGDSAILSAQSALNAAKWTTGNPTMPRMQVRNPGPNHYTCPSCAKSVATSGRCAECSEEARKVDERAQRFLSTLEGF